jgi:hypothetical protein
MPPDKSRSGKSNWPALNKRREQAVIRKKKTFKPGERLFTKVNPLKMAGVNKQYATKLSKAKAAAEAKAEEEKAKAKAQEEKQEAWSESIMLQQLREQRAEIIAENEKLYYVHPIKCIVCRQSLRTPQEEEELPGWLKEIELPDDIKQCPFDLHPLRYVHQLVCSKTSGCRAVKEALQDADASKQKAEDMLAKAKKRVVKESGGASWPQ